MAEKAEKKTPRDILRVVFRHKVLFFLGAAVFAVAALVGARFMPVKYTGEAVVEVGLEAAAEQISKASSQSLETVKQHLRFDLAEYQAIELAVAELKKMADMPDETQVLLSPAAEMAQQQLIRDLRALVGVHWEARSVQKDRISVSFTHEDPWLAEHMPNALIRLYIDRTYDNIRGSLKRQHDFLSKKVDDLDQRLTGVRKRQLDFETTHAGSMPDTPGALQERIQEINSDVDTVRRQQAVAKQRAALIAGLLNQGGEVAAAGDQKPPAAPAPGAGPPEKAPPEKGAAAPAAEGPPAAPAEPPLAAAQPPKAAAGPVAAAAEPAKAPAEPPPERPKEIIKVPNIQRRQWEEQLRRYREQLDEARTLKRMTDKHPTVIGLTEQIAELEKRIQAAPEYEIKEVVYDVSAPPVDDAARRAAQQRREALLMESTAAQAEVDMTTRELERLEARLATYQTLLANFGAVRQNYEQILKEGDDLRGQLGQWDKRLADVQVALAAEVESRATQLQAAQLAQHQYIPSSPKLLHVLGFALVGSLAFGVGLVHLANLMDRTVRTTEDASEHFGLPVCGVVGEIITPGTAALRRMRRWTVYPTIWLVLLAVLSVAALNIVLWLRYPDRYRDWAASPTTFIGQTLSEAVDKAREVL